MDFVEWAESSMAVSQQVDEWMVKLADICDKRNLEADQMSLAVEIIKTMAEQDKKVHEVELVTTYVTKRKEEISKRFEEVTAQRIRSQLNIKRLNEEIERVTEQEEAKRETMEIAGTDCMSPVAGPNVAYSSRDICPTPLSCVDRSSFVEKRKKRRSLSAAAIHQVKKVSQRIRSVSRGRLA